MVVRLAVNYKYSQLWFYTYVCQGALSEVFYGN